MNGDGSSEGVKPKVEQADGKPLVAGSIPALPTNFSDAELLAQNALPTDDLSLHAFRWMPGVPPPAEIPLDEKLKHLVWQGKDHAVIRLPADPDWYQREGYDMEHCLQYLHHSYARSAQDGDIELYSMIDRNGKPQVDIELAVWRGHGVNITVTRPTVTQIRGFRNQCPPADHLLPDLVAFLLNRREEESWELICPRPNFDGRYDGALLALRWMELNPPDFSDQTC